MSKNKNTHFSIILCSSIWKFSPFLHSTSIITHPQLQASVREADLHAATTRAQEREAEAMGLMSVAENKAGELERCRADIERELAAREDRVAMQETVLHERTKMLNRREEDMDRKGRYMEGREGALKHRESIMGTTMKEVERRTATARSTGIVTVSPSRVPHTSSAIASGAGAAAAPASMYAPAALPRSTIQDDLDSIRTTLASLTLPVREPAAGLSSPPLPQY